MKYRNKLIIEAEQYEPGMEDGFVERYIDPKNPNISWGIKTNYNDISINIPFIYAGESKHSISNGDYIITNESGIRSVCKSKIFHEIYEPIENNKNYPYSIITKNGIHIWIGL